MSRRLPKNALKELTWKKRIREECLVSQNGRCWWCDTWIGKGAWKSDEASLDHLLPISKGNPFFTNQVVAACRKCNSRRGSASFATNPHIQLPLPKWLIEGLRLKSFKELGIITCQSTPTTSFNATLRALPLISPLQVLCVLCCLWRDARSNQRLGAFRNGVLQLEAFREEA